MNADSVDDRPRGRWLSGGELAIAGLVGGGLYLLTGHEIIWVIGGVVGGAVACRYARHRGAGAEPSGRTRKLGQLLVGAAVGPTLAAQELSASAGALAVLALAVLAILGGSLVVAKVYCSRGPVDGITAGMATLPGGIGIMPSVAAELGRPADLVAMVQAFRMTVVVLLVMVTTVVSDAGAPDTAVPDAVAVGGSHAKAWLPPNPAAWGYVAVLLAGAFVAARIAREVRVPVPTLLGPLLFGCLFALGLRAAGVEPAALVAPFAQEAAGQALLGITVGEYLAQRYRGSRGALSGGLLGVLATCLLAVGIASGMTALSPWSFLTCLLMVAPGGAPEMVVIAAATGDELTLVLAAQTGRQVLVNVLMPVWIRLFTRFDRT